MTPATTKRSIDTTIIGAGTLATALAMALRRSGHRVVEIVARNNAQSISRARKLAKRVDARVGTLLEAQFNTKATWICVPDDAIFDVAGQIATRGNWTRKIAIHSSGALGSEALAPLKTAGAGIASAHPLMSFVRSSKPELEGVPFALEGDRNALVTVSMMVRSLGGKPFRIPAELKPAYHLFGFFSSPALVALIAAAQRVGELAGIDPGTSRQLMDSIVRQTTDNCLVSTPQHAFSGPLRRGDIATLRKHLEVLKEQPELLRLYKALTSIALQYLPVTNHDAVKKLIG